jgi:hypothetical protein
MALDRTLTTLDPGRGARRMAADVRQALTEALGSLSAARRALRMSGGPPTPAGRKDFLGDLEELSTWLRSYVGTLARVPATERFSVEVPYLRIKGFRDHTLEERLHGGTSPPAPGPAETPAAAAPERPGVPKAPVPHPRRSRPPRRRKGR